ncbi:acetyl/propionyl/methylcrotonyl-CoA carboxylase subunit alpha [Rhodospirillales bacterium]|nr:acetyl/propionyl/methylcrotonyl-CoA carboxylase subunit alpha [Rhodospirillales bacterium]
MTAIRCLLIANRGEIACRIIDTARRMGVRTVAVYSDADANARHVELADTAIRLGPAPASESYLKIDLVIDAAKCAGADAIHPGYGFLSENAKFASAVEAAGLIFVGPSANAIRAMGSKSSSKVLMTMAGVPLVPGYHGKKQDIKTLQKAADDVGYPVLVKASAGGGGKGMRVVKEAKDLASAVQGAAREAKSAFGDQHLMIEKYLPRARHVEIQVFGDSHGNYVYLFERDCSLQRRHQKVIEEAPAPGMTENLRDAMGTAAVNAARAVDYVGAGTVEFLLAGSDFYFIEMNTRLQVEHPITEAITGQDLVEWQLKVAGGETLPKSQAQLSISGHSFEARLYAEDPDRGYLPQTGTLHHLLFPSREGVRVDTGIRSGDVVSVHYDPMLAKIVVHGPDRDAALATLHRALADTEIAGVETNLDFLLGVSQTKHFSKANIDTGWLDKAKAPKGGWSRARAADDIGLVQAAMHVLRERGLAACARAAISQDRFSPWFHSDGWRVIDRGFQDIHLVDLVAETDPVVVRARNTDSDGFVIEIADRQYAVSQIDDRMIEVDGVRIENRVARAGLDTLIIFNNDGRNKIGLVDPAAAVGDETVKAGGLRSPMPGKIVSVFVKAGQKVTKGTPLLIMEAMKMEHTIVAPSDGTVSAVSFAAGSQIEEGVFLVEFDPA